MSATYVVDGYNLLHAMGVLGGPLGPRGLEKARLQLLGLLQGAFGEDSSAVTVVFDAAGAWPGAEPEARHGGLYVLFAVGQQEADDVIERLIRQSSAPKNLEVVSDDRRVQQAARRRQCTVRGCDEFLRLLDERRRTNLRRATDVPEKNAALSQKETQHWMEEFGDLEKDPWLRRAFETFDFEKD